MSNSRYLPVFCGKFLFSKLTVIMHIIRKKITLEYSAQKFELKLSSCYTFKIM